MSCVCSVKKRWTFCNVLKTSAFLFQGADLSDYFNYGFNEDTWKAYCEKQKRIRMGLEILPVTSTTNKITVTSTTFVVFCTLFPLWSCLCVVSLFCPVRCVCQSLRPPPHPEPGVFLCCFTGGLCGQCDRLAAARLHLYHYSDCGPSRKSCVLMGNVLFNLGWRQSYGSKTKCRDSRWQIPSF